jgi:hypothetical protein
MTEKIRLNQASLYGSWKNIAVVNGVAFILSGGASCSSCAFVPLGDACSAFPCGSNRRYRPMTKLLAEEGHD